MTKNTARKTAAKRTAPKTKPEPQAAEPRAAEPRAAEPMDKTMPEDPTLVSVPPNRARPCWAIKRLVSEVSGVFPDIPTELSNYTGRNAALDVSFDTSVLDNDDAISLIEVLAMLNTDPRVETVVYDDPTEAVLISMKSHPTTMDRPDPFGVDAALRTMLAPSEEVSTE